MTNNIKCEKIVAKLLKELDDVIARESTNEDKKSALDYYNDVISDYLIAWQRVGFLRHADAVEIYKKAYLYMQDIKIKERLKK